MEERLGYTFSELSLLDAALTHTSYVKGDGKAHEHNERLEFLGDAVLELCVSEYLYRNFPKLNEGVMTGPGQPPYVKGRCTLLRCNWSWGPACA